MPIETGDWKERLAAVNLFAPLSEEHLQHVEHLDAGDLGALVSTWSPVQMLPEADRTELLDQVRELVADQVMLELRYRVDMFPTSKLGASGMS